MDIQININDPGNYLFAQQYCITQL